MGVPQITLARAARIHGAIDLFDPAEIAADREATGPIGVVLNSHWGLGDAICLTAAMRDVHAAWPGEFHFYMQTCYPDVFAGLAGVSPLASASTAPEIRYQIAGRHPDPAGKGEHITEFFRRKVGQIINRKIPAGEKRPWLTKPAEVDAPCDGKYWILAAGWRSDLSVKAWPPERWQQVIDALTARGVKLVLIGAAPTKDVAICDLQPKLHGNVVDLVGKTSVAEMFGIIAHPNCVGTIGLESSHAHVARAYGKRAVVISGSRIASGTVRYGVPEETWLGDDMLPCAGCDVHYSAPRDAKDKSVCLMPHASGYATCMRLIAPEQVVAAVVGETHTFPHVSTPAKLRVGLCSYYSPNIESWAQPAAQRMQEYCQRNGYFYAPFDPAKPPAQDKNSRWQKAAMISPHLMDLDLMAWVDADCVIVRPDFRIESVLEYGEADLYLTKDVNGMNAGVIIMRNTPAAFELLVRWKKTGMVAARAQSRNSDQDELGRCIAEMGDRLKVIYLPKPLINAYDATHAEPGDESPGWLVHCVSDEDKYERMARQMAIPSPGLTRRGTESKIRSPSQAGSSRRTPK